MKAIKHLSKWDEYRQRREQIMALFWEAKQRLAMKKAWVYMISSYTNIIEIHKQYRVKYMIQQLADKKDMCISRIKAVYKLSMIRKFA